MTEFAWALAVRRTDAFESEIFYWVLGGVEVIGEQTRAITAPVTNVDTHTPSLKNKRIQRYGSLLTAPLQGWVVACLPMLL